MSFIQSLSLQKRENKKINLYKISIGIVLAILLTDTIYSSWYGIHYHTREKCVIYKFFPSWLFLIYEYLVELFLVVLAGTFAGTLTEKYFTRYRKFLPKNQLSAFVYASVIPVCSCSAIPLIESMKNKLPLRTIITFVMAAPLLNPYIIFLSYSILGFWYGNLRILGSFLIALSVGFIVDFAHKRQGQPEIGLYKNCDTTSCGSIIGKDVYRKTWVLTGKIAPYILMAGILGLLFELTGPLQLIDQLPFDRGIITLLLLTGTGTAIYLCNGADILFLAPVLQYTDLGLGDALAFSLSSTAVCASSIIMLSRFLGRKLTFLVTAATIFTILVFSFVVNLVFQ